MVRRAPSPLHFGAFSLVLALIGCSNPESASRSYLAKGDEYFAAKQYEEAGIEYRNAIQRMPRMADGHYKLGEVLAAKSDVVGALAAYVRAADLNPDLLDAQVKAAQLLMLARRYDDARTRLRIVLTKEPSNTTALLMLGNALAGLGNLDEAVAANQRAIALNPQRAGMYINLGALQYIHGNKEEAEAAYLAAVKADPTSVEAVIGLADYYWIVGKNAESERLYLAALKMKPEDPNANESVGIFYIRSGRMLEAEPYLRKTAEISKSSTKWYALANYYIATNRTPLALTILQTMRSNPATSSQVTVRMAFIASVNGQRAIATRLVDEVLAKDPAYVEALALKTHLLLSTRKRLEALAMSERAVAADRKSEAAHFAHAVAAMANHQTDVAKAAFQEVFNLNPGSVEATLELAQMNLDQGLLDTALQLADQAVRNNPGLIEARLMRLRVMANHSERREEAAKDLTALLARYPKSAEVQYEAGLVAVSRKDRTAAYRYFNRARELRPGYRNAVIELTKLDVEGNKLPDARRRVDELVKAYPESIEALLIAGNTYALIDPEIAERHLRKVLTLDPSSISAYQSLAALYLARNQLDKARSEFILLSEQQPMDVAPATMVGIISEAQGNKADAEKWYQQALRINGRAATAANNLAWLYVERGQHLEAAIELAQIARGELPRQAEVTDTLGWAYLKKGLLAQAVRTLEEAVQQDAKNPLYHYHLGLAYSMNGEDGRARISLKQSLSLDPKSPFAPDAQRALAKLLY